MCFGPGMMMPRPQPSASEATHPELTPRVRLKFAGDSGFHAELKRRVLEYFEHSGLSPKGGPRLYVKTAVMLLWFGASYASLVFLAETWWQALLLSCSLAFAMAGIAFAVQHDANHGAYSKHGAINRLIGMTLDILGGSSYVWHWKHNVAHHTYTNLNGADSDIDVPFGRLSPGQPRGRIHRFQQFYLWAVYGLFAIHWQFFEDVKQVAEARIAENRFPRPHGWRLVEMIGGKAVFIAWAFVVPALFHPLWVVLLTYAATSVAFSYLLVVVFQLAHSVEEAALPALTPGAKEVPRAWAVHQVEATVDFARGNRLLSWYLGGLNFQIEHHLFPRICHLHYPHLAAIVQPACTEFGVRYTAHESLLGAVCSHWRWLRRMGRPLAEVHR